MSPWMWRLLTPSVFHTWSIWVLYRVNPMIFRYCLGLGFVCYLHLPTTYYKSEKHQHLAVQMANHQWSTTTTSSAWFRIREGLHSNKPIGMFYIPFFSEMLIDHRICIPWDLCILYMVYSPTFARKNRPFMWVDIAYMDSMGLWVTKYQKCGAPWSLESRQLSLVVFSHMICKGNFYPPVN